MLQERIARRRMSSAWSRSLTSKLETSARYDSLLLLLAAISTLLPQTGTAKHITALFLLQGTSFVNIRVSLPTKSLDKANCKPRVPAHLCWSLKDLQILGPQLKKRRPFIFGTAPRLSLQSRPVIISGPTPSIPNRVDFKYPWTAQSKSNLIAAGNGVRSPPRELSFLPVKPHLR